MALVEIARFTDVYEADLAAAFLESHDIEVSVTERFQTTVDPLMQRALGIRLLGRADQAAEARDLLERARGGEFIDGEDDPVTETPHARALTVASMLAVLMAAGGIGWGSSRPRRFRTIHWIGLGLIVAVLTATVGLTWLAGSGLLGPSPFY